MSYDPKPAVNITTLHTAIKAALATQFPGVTVDYYSRPGDKVKTPAILFELDSIEPDGDDMGTEQLPVILRFNAYAVREFGEKDQNKLLVRLLAANVAAFIRGHKWSQPVKRAVFEGVSTDQFDGDAKNYEVMRIEWTHEAILGADVWADTGAIPDTVFTNEQGTGYEQIEPPV